MNPAKVIRSKVRHLTDLPNIGKATAGDLRLLGIRAPEQLVGQCPLRLYERLCRKTGVRHDPCVIDVFMSVTSFMEGGPARPWWELTEARKRLMSAKEARPTRASNSKHGAARFSGTGSKTAAACSRRAAR